MEPWLVAKLNSACSNWPECNLLRERYLILSKKAVMMKKNIIFEDKWCVLKEKKEMKKVTCFYLKLLTYHIFHAQFNVNWEAIFPEFIHEQYKAIFPEFTHDQYKNIFPELNRDWVKCCRRKIYEHKVENLMRITHCILIWWSTVNILSKRNDW